MNLPPAKIDLGKLTYVYELTEEVNLNDFVENKLSGAHKSMDSSQRTSFFTDLAELVACWRGS